MLIGKRELLMGSRETWPDVHTARFQDKIRGISETAKKCPFFLRTAGVRIYCVRRCLFTQDQGFIIIIGQHVGDILCQAITDILDETEPVHQPVVMGDGRGKFPKPVFLLQV